MRSNLDRQLREAPDPAMPHPWRAVLLVAAGVMCFAIAWLYLRRLGAPASSVFIKLLFASVPVTSAVLIGLSFVMGPAAHLLSGRWQRYVALRKQLGLMGLYFAAFHAVWGLARLQAAHYPQLYESDGSLTMIAELSMLAGVGSLMVLAIVGTASLPMIEERMPKSSWMLVQRLAYAAITLAIAHFVLLKWQGWLDTSQWRFGLPPLSLLLFSFLLFVFALRVFVIFSASPTKTNAVLPPVPMSGKS